MTSTAERTTVDARVDRLRAAADEAGLDAVLVTNDASIAYFTGFWGMQLERLFAVAVPVSGGGALVVPRIEEEAVAGAPSGLERVVYDPTSDGIPELVEALGGARRVGVEEDHLVFARAEALRAAGCDPSAAGGVVMGLRVRKDADEVERMRTRVPGRDRGDGADVRGARGGLGRAGGQRPRRVPAPPARRDGLAPAGPLRAERGQPAREPGRPDARARRRGLRRHLRADRRLLGRPDALRHRRRALGLGAGGLGDGTRGPGRRDRGGARRRCPPGTSTRRSVASSSRVPTSAAACTAPGTRSAPRSTSRRS